MTVCNRFRIALASLLVALLPAGAGYADTATTRLTVVELFTSQSCYSCPPAERLLGKLAGRDDIIALEHHVDYWDQLVYGSAGRWKDAFSSPEATQRQRDYNRAIRGTGSVYTPQMVVNGRLEVVGNRPGEVETTIVRAGLDRKRDGGVAVAVAPRSGGLDIRIDGEGGAKADVWIVRFLTEHTTEVTAGENKGKTLTNHHIVREVRHVGSWKGTAQSVVVNDFALEEGFGCAVIVQQANAGPILGAAHCPAPVS